MRQRSLDALLWAGVALGILSRLRRFLDARSLWGDEAMLALNVLERGFLGLLAPLDHDQAAAPGFLWLVKATSLALGEGELALRLWPLLAGLLSVWVFHRLAQAVLPGRAGLLALLLFSLAEPQVYYAAELKPYSFDVLFGLLLVQAGVCASRSPLDRRTCVGLAALGGLAIWFSNAAVLVAAGVACVLLSAELAAGRRERVRSLALVCSVWALSFAASYVLLLAEARDNTYLTTFWARGMPPGLTDPGAVLRWYARSFPGFFNDPLGIPIVALAAPAFLVGAMLLQHRSARLFGLVASPIAISLLAAHLGVYPFATTRTPDVTAGSYPFTGRLILFTAPSAYLLVAAGLAFLHRLASREHSFLGMLPALLLVSVPLGLQLRNVLSPPRFQELRPVVEALGARIGDEDVVYLQSFSEPVFAYYQRRTGLGSVPTRPVSGTGAGLHSLALQLRGQAPGSRIWLVVLHHPNWGSDAEERRIRAVLARFARAGEPSRALRASATPFTFVGPPKARSAAPQETRSAAPHETRSAGPSNARGAGPRQSPR